MSACGRCGNDNEAARCKCGFKGGPLITNPQAMLWSDYSYLRRRWKIPALRCLIIVTRSAWLRRKAKKIRQRRALREI